MYTHTCLLPPQLFLFLPLLNLNNGTERKTRSWVQEKPRDETRTRHGKHLAAGIKAMEQYEVAWKAGPRYRAPGEHQKGPSKQEPGPGILVPEPKNNVCEQKDKEFPKGRSIQTTMKSQRHR